jgi:flagellar biosynthesis protein FliP
MKTAALIVFFVAGVLLCGWTVPAEAKVSSTQSDALALPMGVSIKFDATSSPREASQSIKILMLLTLLSLAPSAMIMTTSFTRILIVFGFLRQALGTQSSPPTQVLAGIALFLTLFIMAPVWQKINKEAVQPYLEEEISQQDAWNRGIQPVKEFMARQTGKSEMALFMELSGKEKTADITQAGLETMVPAFMISELKKAFQMGFLIYLPFLVIDMVVATILMALGMMMLPPMMISLPVKLLFFVMADGWTIMVRSLIMSFSG